MKKLILTTAIVLGLATTTFAAGGNGSLFQRNYNAENNKSGFVYFSSRNTFMEDDDIIKPALPNHGLPGNQPAPLGSGIAVLAGLGAAYMVAKKRREE